MAFCPSGYADNTNMNISTCTINKNICIYHKVAMKNSQKVKMFAFVLVTTLFCVTCVAWYPVVETSLQGKGTLVHSGIVMKRRQGDGFFTFLPLLDYPQRSTAVSRETRRSKRFLACWQPLGLRGCPAPFTDIICIGSCINIIETSIALVTELVRLS